ncbi:MAG: putative ATP-grasp superfamily ATP-dependent carboligase [Candidatus Pelagisphaera sp.]|jgi:predicted ATP-grasp superfamily ATP-dependent carboligase
MGFHATLIIPLGNGRLPLRVARCLVDSSLEFVLFSKDRKNVSKKSKFCRELVFSDPADDTALVKQLLDYKVSHLPEILFPVTTPGFQFIARNRDELKIRFRIPPISTIENLEIASNKRLLYDFSIENQFPVLTSISPSEILKNKTYDIPFPVLAKTTNREFGAGFLKIDTATDLKSFVESLKSNERSDYIIQPFIEGKDVSFSAYCEKGEIKCYTVWKALFYGRKKYQIPLCIEFLDNRRAFDLATQLLRKLRWEGVCDIDFFEDEKSGDLFLLEVNARLWGNVVGCALRGINFPKLLCDVALGKSERQQPRQTNGIYCYPKGIPAALKRNRTRSALFRHPFATTGLIPVIKDIAPEFYKFYLKLKLLLGELLRRSSSNK